MIEPSKLKNPWMVAVWPGMGQVAISAGYYLMAKLQMEHVADFAADDLFDVDAVEVKGGLIGPARLPKNRVFAWSNPNGEHDLLVFIGEAQPPIGKYLFCNQLVEFASTLNVTRVFTFAAMATGMRPEHPSRVFCASTDSDVLAELKEARLHTLDDGNIGGLNGLLAGAAANQGIPGVCLLGEMPHVFTQFPYPKAALGVLRAFTRLANIELDLTELTTQSELADQHLGILFSRMEAALEQRPRQEEDETTGESYATEGLSAEHQARIESLFEAAQKDRSRAYELKRELDRLGVFGEYEDRFLDLFRKES
jgi:proteasome assembly chaperone (PAC2) family protein